MPSTPTSPFQLSRRHFVQGGLAAAAALALLPRRAWSAEPAAPAPFGWPEIGRLKPSHARDIPASRLSIGFETLDRYQFDPTRTYAHLGRLGVKWARAQTGWCRCETEKGKYDFRWLDEIVEGLRAEGVEPWFNLGYGNRLYTPEAPDVSAVGFAPIFTPEARAGWVAFVDALATHFAGRVKKWEIWNEPNGKKFWRPQLPNAAGYVELVKLTAPVIRRRIPDVTIIGLAHFGCTLPFTEKALAAGLADHVDRISFHPYGPWPERAEGYVGRVRELLGQKADRVKIWQGECGCASDPATEMGENKGRKWNDQLQAKWLTRRILTDLRLDLDLTSYFTTVDLTKYNWGNGQTGHAQSFGVLHGTDYSPKPSYYAFQSLCTLLDARSQLDAKLKASRDGTDPQFRAAMFARQGRGLCAYWTAADLLDPFTARQATLTIPTPVTALIEQPVLVDPLTQRVYAIGAKPVNGTLTIPQLTVCEYPLIVTDRSVVPLA